MWSLCVVIRPPFFTQEFLLPKYMFIDLYLTEEIKAPTEAVTLGQPSLTDSTSLMEINAHAGLYIASVICNLLHQGNEGRGAESK